MRDGLQSPRLGTEDEDPMPSPAFNLDTVHRTADFFEQCRFPRETLKRVLALYLGDKRHWKLFGAEEFFMDIVVDQDSETFLTRLLERPDGPGAFRTIVEALLRVFEPNGKFRDEYDALINHSVDRHPLWSQPGNRDPLPYLYRCHARLLEALREEGLVFDGKSGELNTTTARQVAGSPSRPVKPVEKEGDGAGSDRPIRVVLGEDGKVFLNGEILTVEPELMRRFCKSYAQDQSLQLDDAGEQDEAQVDVQRRVNRLRKRLKEMAGREIIESCGRGTCAYRIVSESIVLP